MPYITDNRKCVIDPALAELITLLENTELDEGFFAPTMGDLNYVLTRIILAYWKRRECYQAGGEISGAMRNAYSEFYRRVMVPYENKKIRQNGDVYDYLNKEKTNERNKSKKRRTVKKAKAKSR